MSTTVHHHSPLLRISEAAEELAVSEKTVRRLIESGALPAVKVGRQLRVDPDELAAYVYGEPT